MVSVVPLPSLARLKEMLLINDDGVLVWRTTSKNKRRRAGARAGSITGDGYIALRIDGRSYLAHRVVFKLIHGRDPVHEIDHRDLVKSNNHPDNLREASDHEQVQNRRAWKRKYDLPKGVGKAPDRRGYSARIKIKGRLIYLGYFGTKEEAHAAYVAAAHKHFGEFANTGA